MPSTRSSGGKTRSGAINRASRHLARSLFTQAIPHLAVSSPSIARFSLEVADRKGRGRARIAVLRKIFSIMRRMLLEGEQDRWVEAPLYAKKARESEREPKKMKTEQEAA